MTDIAQQLRSLPPETRSRLESYGFDDAWFVREAKRLHEEGRRDNRVRGEVAPPADDDISDLPEADSAEWTSLTDDGFAELEAGRAALVVLAGGMATRMGGVVKALVEALPGRTFLDLRLAGHRALEERVRRRIPFWLMTSHATDEAIREALGDRLDGYYIATFPQMVSLRLEPGGGLFLEDDGKPSEHAPGHGDFPDALRRSGLLDRFLEDGGRYVTSANLDNVGATLDPTLIGMHRRLGGQVTCEVVDKVGTDRGGIPARLDGRPMILEEFRIPDTFDPATVRVFNTNTFHFDARALADLDLDWTYFVVEKEVDGRPAIQLERLVNEVAMVLDTRFVRVPRDGAESRFLPVKDNDDLEEKRRSLELVARHRGMI